MTAYDDCLTVEAKGQQVISKWLISQGCTVVFNNHDARGAEFQSFGDLIVVRPEKDKHELVELKIEETNRHGNLFIETWSNKNWWNPGWIVKTKADWLFYYFIEQDELYQLKIEKLRKFIFSTNETGRVDAFAKYQEKPHQKYKQPNQTCGLCVPITDLKKINGLVTCRRPLAAISEAA